jgi:hypothetical protein
MFVTAGWPSEIAVRVKHEGPSSDLYFDRTFRKAANDTAVRRLVRFGVQLRNWLAPRSLFPPLPILSGPFLALILHRLKHCASI